MTVSSRLQEGALFCLWQVKCSLDTVWATWDFFTWLKDSNPDAFGGELGRFGKENDAVNQFRLCRSFSERDSRGIAG